MSTEGSNSDARDESPKSNDDAKPAGLPLALQSEQFEELLTCAVCLDRYKKPKLLPCQHTFCQEPCMEGLVNWLYRKLDCPECRAEHRECVFRKNLVFRQRYEFNRPKLLPCQHTFCETPCLEGLINYVKRKICCPECRAEHWVPIGGVQNFPNNLTIISFLDLTARAAGLTPQPPPPQPISPMDYLKPKLPPAQEINAITGIARLTTAGRQLETESTSAAVSSFTPATQRLTPCPLCDTQHPELLHCSHCQRRICAGCKALHLEGVKADIGRVLHQIRRGFVRLEDSVRAIEAKEEQLKTNVDAVKTEIVDIFVKYKQELENREGVLNTEVNMFGTSETRRLATQKENLQTVLQQMNNFCDNTERQLGNDVDDVTDSELMNLKHQCGINMNSLRAYGPENVDSKRIRFKSEGRHLNAALVVFGQIIETGTGSHSAHLTSRGSPSDSPDSPRTNRPFTSRFLTAERERAAAAAAAAAAASASDNSAAASTAESTTASTEASTEDLTAFGRSNSFHFGGQGRRLGRSSDDSTSNSTANSPSRDTIASRRLAALTGSSVATPISNGPATPPSSAGQSATNVDSPENSGSTGSASDESHGRSLDAEADRLLGRITRPRTRGRAETELLTPWTPRDRAAQAQPQRSGSAEVDPGSRELSPDDTESVTSRIMRRLNTMGLGFEEVAAFSSARSSGRGQPQSAETSETRLTNYLTKSTTTLKFGRRGADEACFTWPRGVAVNDDGEIVVADSSNHRIQVFDSDGTFLRQFGRYGQSDGEFDCLAGVCINRSNGQVVIADRYNHRIQIFTPQGGWIRSFGEEGYWDGQMSYPWGVACAPDGNIFVCDKENHRVQVFHPNGTFMYSFGRLGCDDGCFENPHYVAVAEDGEKVLVSDSGNHRIQIFTATGQHIQTIGREGTLNAQFKYPRGVVFDREGFILVGDSGNNRVQVFRPDGSFYAAFMSWGSMDGQVKGIEGLALTDGGGVVVCDRENHRIQVL